MPRSPLEVATAVFEAVAARDADGLVAHGAPGYTDDFVAVGVFTGQDAIRAFFRELFAAIPDLRTDVERIVADDHSAAVQWHASGTFSGGPFQGILATGRRIDLRGVDVMEISDGLITHNTIYYDGAGFARQIGMLPPRGSLLDRAMTAAFNAVVQIKRRLLSR